MVATTQNDLGLEIETDIPLKFRRKTGIILLTSASDEYQRFVSLTMQMLRFSI